MTENINTIADSDLAQYFKMYFETWDVLKKSIAQLNRRKLTPGVKNEELNQIEVDLLWLAAEHAKLVNRRTAFLSGQTPITPPNAEQVEAVKDLSDKVEKLQQDQNAASGAMALAKKAIGAFAKVQAET